LRFTAEEDAMIIKFVENKGACCWEELAKAMPQRDRRSLRLRYVNTLSRNKEAPFTDHEDELLIESVNKYGKKWAMIRNYIFPHRTDTFLKNRFNLIQRRSVQVSQSPVTMMFKQISNEENLINVLLDFDDSKIFSF
jgi:hypothetical protein